MKLRCTDCKWFNQTKFKGKFLKEGWGTCSPPASATFNGWPVEIVVKECVECKFINRGPIPDSTCEKWLIHTVEDLKK